MSMLTRLKYNIAVYADTVGIVLVILAIVSIGVAGHTYLNPPVEEVPPEEIDVQNFQATVDHSAVVTNKTQLYNNGTTLRNHPVYYRDSMPVLTLSTRADVPEDKNVHISYELVVRQAAVFNGEQFWENETVLDAKEQQVEDGSFVSNVSIRISELERIISGPRQAVTVGTVSTRLGFRLSYTSPSQGGGTYEGQLSSFIRPQISSQAYWFPSDLSAEETKRQTTEPQVRKLSPDMQRVGIFVLIGIVLGAVGIGIAWWSTQKVDIEELAVNITKEKYDPWISEGEFPTDVENQYVYITSLQDLVDIAIDTNKRVLYDSEFEAYAVVDGSVIYYYATRPETIKNFLNAPA